MQRYRVNYMFDCEPDHIMIEADTFEEAELRAYAEIPAWSVIESISIQTQWMN